MDNAIAQNVLSNALGSISSSNVQSASGSLAAAGKLSNADPKDVAKTARDFEAVFLTQMLQQMFAQVPTDKIFGGGQAEETWRTLLLDEYGKVFAKSGGIGIAAQVQKELLRAQETG